ncbi:hypothetical protein EPUS_08955 [Endocarpon pusillum Z07020]|uniref:Shugoshin C-terminal domain-containing protein n=1 Tax=Endocarpon pusillum (strain Z07020 / HMAS-L-300199) TaxID=1263415 RepID=U1GRA4_ENDPU|nr:uncharacterized protein EPUS_08955 [Endocarpon pusillum Z07020]ERF74903.1 hypothetical protein EPUS_08955 [Endocarpon pusillum Z07020]
MARLNEPPPAIESIDALKRRFIRQNREIARVNSTQSLRIRNLEAEISRLLAENIAIREQAINSAQEAERLRSSQRVFRDVSKLKEQLESKLSEVSTLVTELGALPEKAKRRSSQHQRRRSGFVEPVQSPDQKDWRNRQTIGGVVAVERQLQEGRLPVIVEGKHYPRKTLESLEISRLLEDDATASESPELGPPPVAHFDVAEPIGFAAIPAPEVGTVQLTEGYQDHNDDFKPLPDNLERRRRRRASALLEDMSTLNQSSTESSSSADQRLSLKSGAKRKLDVQEDGYREGAGPSQLDDFAFQRRAIVAETPQTRPKSSRFAKSGTTSATSSATTKGPTAKLEPSTRRVLAPKSTNSPSKSKRTGVDDKNIPAKEELASRVQAEEQFEPQNVQVKTAESSVQDQPRQTDEAIIAQRADGIELPPKTPAGLDLFSPASTEPSARTGQQTEIAPSASVEDVLGGADGRTSRRARGAVSYAEPSLRAKMRRPTKELAPAVGDQTNGLKAQPRDSSARAESQERQSNQDVSVGKMRTVTIKREKPSEESLAWKGLPEAQEEPTSPLVNKGTKSSSRNSPPATQAEAEAGTETAPNANADTQHLEAALDGLSILEGADPSPHNLPNSNAIQSRKTSRRHSPNLTSSRRVGQEFENPSISSDRPQPKTTAAHISDQPPRPHSAASLRKDNHGRDDKVGLKKSASVTTLKSSTSTSSAQGGSAPNGAGTGVGRTERAAARRRSMMI